MQSVGSWSSVEDSCLVVVVLADNFPEISNAGFRCPSWHSKQTAAVMIDLEERGGTDVRHLLQHASQVRRHLCSLDSAQCCLVAKMLPSCRCVVGGLLLHWLFTNVWYASTRPLYRAVMAVWTAVQSERQSAEDVSEWSVRWPSCLNSWCLTTVSNCHRMTVSETASHQWLDAAWPGMHAAVSIHPTLRR